MKIQDSFYSAQKILHKRNNEKISQLSHGSKCNKIYESPEYTNLLKLISEKNLLSSKKKLLNDILFKYEHNINILEENIHLSSRCEYSNLKNFSVKI